MTKELRYAGDNLIIDGVDPRDNTYDTFNTPRNFVKASINILHDLWAEECMDYPYKVLDPGAGNGVWGQVFKEYWDDATLFGVEMQEMPVPNGYDEWFAPFDFLEWISPIGKFDAVIGNPPFGIYRGKRDRYLAEKFIRHSMSMLKPGGVLYFLLKSDYTHGIERNFGKTTKARGYEPGLYEDYPLYWKFESVRRIPFLEEKGNSTNNVKYATYLWVKGAEPRLKSYIPYTPVSRFNWEGGRLQWAH